MSTLLSKTIASTYNQLVKRADTYIQTGGNIELMNASGTMVPTGLYLESGATTDNVGIGTATPSALLDIVGGDNTLQILGADATSNEALKEFRIATRHYLNAEENFLMVYAAGGSSDNELFLGGGSSGFNAATDIHFYTGPDNTSLVGTKRMTIDETGLVGIEDASPSQLLTVGDSGGSGHADAAVLGVYNPHADGSGIFIQTAAAELDEYLIYARTNAFGASNDPVLCVSAIGRVGIRTDHPDENLQVLATQSGASEDIITWARLDEAVGGLLGVDSSNNITIGSQTDHHLLFCANGNTNGKMIILTDGNVGIGAAVPDTMLHVEKSTTSTSAATYPTLRIQNTSTSTASYAALQIWGNDTSTQFYVTCDGIGGAAHLGTQTNHSLGIATNATTRVTISAAGAVTPASNNTYTLGSASYRWSDLRSVLINGADIGMKSEEGDWTLREGHDGIYACNNESGQKGVRDSGQWYKLNMTAVSRDEAPDMPEDVIAAHEAVARLTAADAEDLKNKQQQGDSSNEQEQEQSAGSGDSGGDAPSESSGEDSGGADGSSSDSSDADESGADSSESGSGNSSDSSGEGSEDAGSSGSDASDDSEGGSGEDDSEGAGEPSEEWTKDQLKAYMDENSIEYNSGDTKQDLLDKIALAGEGPDEG